MKLGKSKLALAKVINENGGWADDSVYAANDEGGIICGYSSKPNRSKLTPYFWSGGQRNTWIRGIKTPQWHQVYLSREEYYHAYPKADADGWIEWGGKTCPVSRGTLIDVRFRDGSETIGVSAMTDSWNEDHVQGKGAKRVAVNWDPSLPVSAIVSYRLHKTEVKPEFCESVTRSIPEPEVEASKSRLAKNLGLNVDVKPTIEQLAQDYRNAKDYADRLKVEANDAMLKAESIRIEAANRIIDLAESLK